MLGSTLRDQTITSFALDASTVLLVVLCNWTGIYMVEEVLIRWNWRYSKGGRFAVFVLLGWGVNLWKEGSKWMRRFQQRLIDKIWDECHWKDVRPCLLSLFCWSAVTTATNCFWKDLVHDAAYWQDLIILLCRGGRFYLSALLQE